MGANPADKWVVLILALLAVGALVWYIYAEKHKL